MDCTCDGAMMVLIGILAVFYVPAGIGLVLAYRKNAREWAPFVDKGE